MTQIHNCTIVRSEFGAIISDSPEQRDGIQVEQEASVQDVHETVSFTTVDLGVGAAEWSKLREDC